MKQLLTTWGMLMLFNIVSSAQAPSTFRHPGIFSSQTDLDFIKTTVAANNGSPLIAGYNTLSGDSKGSLSYNAEPYAVVNVVASGSSPAELAFRRDAHAAYIHAIKWVVTGNNAHRDKSIQIMNAWSYLFQSLSTAPDKPNQPTLEAGWALPIWLAGAEIIKTYNGGAAGWSSEDKSKFESFVRKIMTYVNGPIASAPNWYISKGLSLLAAGVYLEEASTYNAGYNIIIPQLDAITTSGQIPELNRDFVHSQYVLIGLAQAAEVAYQQGNSALYTRTNGASQPRLLLGSEHYTRCLLGTNTPNYQSESAWARKSAPYEILLLRYTQLGMSVPNTSNYVLNQNRVENGVEDHFLGWLTATHSQAPSVTQTPFSGTPINLPGRVEAENYDNGGQNIAYNDNTAGNNGNVYRNDNVDIQPAESDYAIGWIAQGEWLEYTVNVGTAGVYTLNARVSATTAGKTFHVELNGQNISGAIAVPVTGSYQTYATVSVTTPALTTGIKTLRMVMDASSFNIHYLDFSTNSSSFSTLIQAENWASMSGVQTETTTDTGGGLNVGYIETGDWMTYSVNIPTSGSYKVIYRVASPNASATLRLEKDAGATQLGTLALPQTGGWQTWANASHIVTLPAGSYSIGIATGTGGFNINYLTITNNLSGRSAVNSSEFDEDENITLSPNPVQDQLAIEGINEIHQIRVFDLQGRENILLVNPGKSINVSGLTPGLHVAIVEGTNGEIVKKKFIKK